MSLLRASAIVLLVLSVALLGWVLYDASNIVAFFGLGAYADEATVALLGLGLAAAGMLGGVAMIRASRAHA